MATTHRKKRTARIYALLTAFAVAAAFAGFWAGAISFQYKLKPYFYALKIINKVSTFNPDSDFGYHTLSILYREQRYSRKVTFLGDSIVAYGKWDVLFNTSEIDNHGIPGDTTQGLSLRLNRHEVVGPTAIIMLGVNDLKMEISREQTKSNLKQILKSLVTKRVILVSTLKTTIPSANEKIAGMIDFERFICLQPNCTFVDANVTLAPQGALKKEYSVDGVHLNWQGYRALSPVISRALQEID